MPQQHHRETECNFFEMIKVTISCRFATKRQVEKVARIGSLRLPPHGGHFKACVAILHRQ